MTYGFFHEIQSDESTYSFSDKTWKLVEDMMTKLNGTELLSYANT